MTSLPKSKICPLYINERTFVDEETNSARLSYEGKAGKILSLADVEAHCV